MEHVPHQPLVLVSYQPTLQNVQIFPYLLDVFLGFVLVQMRKAQQTVDVLVIASSWLQRVLP